MVTVARFVMEFIRIIVTITRPYSDCILDFIYHLFMGKTKPLPPITNKILLMSAIELAERIRKRQLSCEEVMTAYVDRAQSVHPLINAVVDERFEDAIRDAKNVDRYLASGTQSEQEIAIKTPLLGVPFTCKEGIGVKGMTQTSGLIRARGRVAEEDSASAALYRKAGAIPLTVTNVPELCKWWETSNHLFGLTHNPYDNTRTVGGSSGGEGSIITSGGALIGIGNDIAGSIRMPAAFCGIYGHKPSRGIISNWGTYPFCQENYTDKPDRMDEFNSTGPMCRYVEDLPLLLKVLSGDDKRIKWTEKVNFRNVKVYYMEELPGILNAAVPDVKQAIKKAVKHFQGQFGIQAIPLNCSELKYSFPIWESKLLEYDCVAFKDYMAGPQSSVNLWWEFFKNIFGCSEHTMGAIYFGMVDRRSKNAFYNKCLEKLKSMEKKFKEILEDQDAILLVPTHPEPPPHHYMAIPMYPNMAYTCIFNVLGLPSTQVPAGLSKGSPIGLQAVSGRYKDHLTIAAALELDAVFNGWISPCRIEV